jgi:hypothetical protein
MELTSSEYYYFWLLKSNQLVFGATILVLEFQGEVLYIEKEIGERNQ